MKILPKVVEWWPRIITQQEELAAHPFLPLHNLQGVEVAAGLTSLRAGLALPVSPAQIPTVGKLNELQALDLLELRKAIYARVEKTNVRVFAEKLLKHTEIKFPNVSGLHPTLDRPTFAAALLVSFFLDFWVESGDARYLNISWKLLDYQTARRDGYGSGPGLPKGVAQALLCRNLLLATQGLQKL